jgi:oxygen-independent coproporphyrinogen-3 oxidase
LERGFQTVLDVVLHGTDSRYAIEQALFTLYPQLKLTYTDRACGGDSIQISLREGERYLTATAVLRKEGKRGLGRASAALDRLQTPLLRERGEQRLLRDAIYRAARHAGHSQMPWGAVTGVRPGKLMVPILESGRTGSQAETAFCRRYGADPLRAELCRETAESTRSARRLLQPQSVCLYIGIPFCPTRCAYCSFVSQSVEKNRELVPAFLDALARELDSIGEICRQLSLRVESVYLGGGTPTTLSAQQLEILLTRLHDDFDLQHCRELTVEAGRPDTITVDRLEALQKCGATRISVNPQTMSDAVLRAIGRRHTAEDIRHALALVRERTGFSVNMDLIAGLPEDTPDGFSLSLREVLTFRPENITVHTLSLKKGSRLIRQQGESLPDGKAVGGMLREAYRSLRDSGYRPYYLYRQKNMLGGFENTGWTLPGEENLYNICMMEELCSVLAAGGGGSTKLIAPGDGRNLRQINPKYPEEYIRNIADICEKKKNIKEFYNGIQSGRN